MAKLSCNDVILSRTHFAEHVLSTPQLLAQYEAVGGTKEDLEGLVETGRRAQSYNLAQNLSSGVASGSTLETAQQLRELHEEHTALMGVTQAVRLDLQKQGASEELLSTIDSILANNAPLRFEATEVDGAKKRKASSSRSQEAIRREIEDDATALIGLTAAHEALSRRKLTPERLAALQAKAQALAGKLSSRTAKKGATQTNTQEERKAVAEQGEIWASCYRLLAALGSQDPSLQAMLAKASFRRK
jgi:hypothetical protein